MIRFRGVTVKTSWSDVVGTVVEGRSAAKYEDRDSNKMGIIFEESFYKYMDWEWENIIDIHNSYAVDINTVEVSVNGGEWQKINLEA
jgi:hypothetical protein